MDEQRDRGTVDPPEMVEQAMQDYDYGDETNAVGLGEYYEKVPE